MFNTERTSVYLNNIHILAEYSQQYMYILEDSVLHESRSEVRSRDMKLFFRAAFGHHLEGSLDVLKTNPRSSVHQ